MIYGLPTYNRPDLFKKKKDKKWIKEAVAYYASLSKFDRLQKQKDIKAYAQYHNLFNENDFEYVTKEFGNEYPVRFKNIPLIRPLFERLLGEELLRNRVYFVRSTNRSALQAKGYKKLEAFLKKKLDEIQRSTGVKLSNQEQKLPYLVEREMSILQEISEIDIVTEAERVGEAIANMIEYKHDIRWKNKSLALDMLISGRAYYRWYIPTIGAMPTLRTISPVSAYHDYSNEVTEIRDMSWFVEVAYMTPDEILGYFGNELTSEEREKLTSGLGRAYAPTHRLYTEDEIAAMSIPYSGTMESHLIPVYFVEFKAYDPVTKDFLLGYDISEEQLNDAYIIERVDEKPKEIKYIENLYEGVMIGDEIIVRAGKSKNTCRMIDNISKTYLTFNGLLNKHNESDVYSYYWALKDLEDLYQILHYHKEKMVALAGVKGMIYDIDAMPPDMDLKDVLYYKKLGLLLISSTQSRSGFNQYAQYNDALDASVSVLMQMIDHVYLEAMRIIGLNPQRMGDVKQETLVGTVQEAVRQSSYTTESIFAIFDKLYRMMIRDGIQMYQKAFMATKSTMASYIAGDGSEKIFFIDKNFYFEDYGLFFVENKKDLSNIEQTKQIAFEAAKAGVIDFADLLKVLKSRSLREMDMLIERSIKMKQEQQQALMQQQAQMEEQQIQKELEKESALLKLKASLEREIKELELKYKMTMEQADNNIDKEKIEKEYEIKKEQNELRRKLLDAEIMEVQAAREVARINEQTQNVKKEVASRREIKNI
jgi:hypothetical protein